MKINVLVLLLVGATRVGAGVHSKITPPLEPVSDAKFMKADYPDDYRAHVYHNFGYPYPVVQDHERYDDDYPTDENDDSGYWKAQLEYDALKNKVEKEKLQMDKAYLKEQEDRREMESVKAAEALAEKAAEKAEAEEKAADAAHDAANDKLKEAKEDVEKETGDTGGEITDLEECKKQLAAAKRKLKSLLEEKNGADGSLDAKAKAEAEAEAKEVAAEQNEAAFEGKVAEEDKEHDIALKTVEEETADVKKTEDALQKAAAKLRKYRKAVADKDGGVYPDKKSSAHGTGTGLLTLLAAVAALWTL